MKKFNLMMIISLVFFFLELDLISTFSTTSTNSKLSLDDELIKLFESSILTISSNSTTTRPTIPPVTTPPVKKTTPPPKTTSPTTEETDIPDTTESDVSHQSPVSSKSIDKESGNANSQAGLSKPSSGKSKLTNSTGGPVPVYKMCSRAKSFALTFDDGPSEFSKELDANLKSHKSKATFFINGFNVGCIYDYADLLITRFKAGHLIGSHTWGHPHLKEGTAEEIHLQLELLEKAMIKILGVKPLWFRPPYGEYNEVVLQVLQERGYKGLVLWSDDSGDSFAKPPSAEKMIDAFNQYPDKSNILSHETNSLTTQEVMPTVVKSLSSKGLKLLPITQCLDISDDPKDWYEFVGKPTKKDATWTCEGTPLPGKFA
ncbi:hypothetical protein DFH28DRAFT_947804 [Melampsora americana]|nr:hypothetical protein DFH28DRAFT_947804 [Melampsora americana]